MTEVSEQRVWPSKAPDYNAKRSRAWRERNKALRGTILDANYRERHKIYMREYRKNLMPLACIDLSIETVPPPKREYRATQLIYCPKCKVKKHQEDGQCVIDDAAEHPVIYVTCPNFKAGMDFLKSYRSDRLIWMQEATSQAYLKWIPEPFHLYEIQ